MKRNLWTLVLTVIVLGSLLVSISLRAGAYAKNIRTSKALIIYEAPVPTMPFYKEVRTWTR